MTNCDADQEADTDHEVAQAEVHDRPLGVVEPGRVHQERGEGHRGREAAQDRPHTQPELRELPVLGGEVGRVAGGGAVVQVGPGHVVVVHLVPLPERHQLVPALPRHRAHTGPPRGH